MDRKFVVYKSSAGSGKTFTLVKEYLKICLSSGNTHKFREILAITFTNKAAAEMKSRIVSTLQELAYMEINKHPMGQVLLVELQLGKEELQQRAKSVLQSILHNYADFSVSTIDQFTYRLIKTFANELQIPVNFEVEMDVDNLLNKIIGMLIDKVGLEKGISELLIRYTHSKTEDEKYYDIENEIKEFSKKLLSEVGSNHLSKLKQLEIGYFIELNREYKKQNTEYKKQLSDLADHALNLIDNNNIEHSSFKRSSIPNWLKKIKDKDEKAYENIEKGLGYCLASDLYKNKLPKSAQLQIDSIAEELTKAFQKMHELYVKEHHLYHTRQASMKYMYALALLNEIEKLFEHIKKEESIVHISDFNKSINSVVEREPVPFIYERIGEKYRHFMVDEFQDTSVLQYENLLPLLDNSLAEENFCMLVGDGKQAIYRWRGGEVEQFSEMPDYKHPAHPDNSLYQERQQSISNHYNEKNLSTNFRSSETVIDFNNRFFSSLKSSLPPRIQQIYKNNEQKAHSTGKTGYVYIEFVPKDGYREGVSVKVLESVNECIRDGYTLKDIAILCRTKKKASIIADFLVDSGISIVSSESLLLSKSKEVMFLISCMKYILNKEDAVAKSIMVEYLCHRNSLDLHAVHVECAGHMNFSNFIKRHTGNTSLESIKDLQIYELSETLLRIFSLHQHYDIYIQTFLEQIYQFQSSKNSGLSTFLEWWDGNCDELYIDAPESMDAVQILTIHKSKGLEFPVVIYPFADNEIFKKSNDVWVDVKARLFPSPESMIVSSNTKNSLYQEEIDVEREKMLMDEINVNYVAFTRAVERLYVYSCSLPSTGKDELNTTAKIIGKGLQGFTSFNESNGVFDLGEKLFRESRDTVQQEVLLPEFISTEWKDKLSLSLEAPADWDSTNTLSSLSYGNLVHRLLSEITSVDDVSTVIAEYSNKGLLSIEEREKMEKELRDILDEKEIRRFFGNGIKAKIEKDILTPKGKSYRPDRVVFRENEIEVVDFKSGGREEWHKEQVLNYAQLISEIEHKKTQAFLIYLNTREVVSL